jgi:GT2 family glycosyltransferase
MAGQMVGSANMEITVAIPTFRRQHAVIATIKEVMRVRSREVVAVLVLDQTPPEEHVRECRLQLDAWHATGFIRLVTLAKGNLPAARNVALREATTEIVVFLDDDVLLQDGFFAAHLSPFADPKVGGVAGQVFHRDFYFPLEKIENRRGAPGTAPHFAWDQYSDDWREIMVGCNHSVRRSAAISAHGYDANIVGGYCEDGDFSYRLRNAGWRVAYRPEAWLVHLKSPSGGCRLARNSSFSERNKLVGFTIYAFRHFHGAERMRLLCRALRAGPLRRENIVAPHRWWPAAVGYVAALRDGYRLRDEVKGISTREN